MKLILSESLYEYDIRGLLMAFYPGEKITTESESEDTRSLSVFYKGEGAGREDGKESTDHLTGAAIIFHNGDFSYETETKLSGDTSEKKTKLKRAIYDILAKDTGKQLPWGTLSGIRPVKIARKKLENGASDEEIATYMREKLYVSEEKTALAIEVSHREKKLLDSIEDGGYCLYVGIPFCPSTCLYCSFSSFTIDDYRTRVGIYLETLRKELIAIQEMVKGKAPSAIYIGGGTPTSIEAAQLDSLCNMIMEIFAPSSGIEWTVEAGRPETITKERLTVLRKYPVTRLSINPQTMQQRTLDLIGRKHTVEDVYEAFKNAREMGFDNINMDLILGLPGEQEEDIRDTISRVASLRPESVTIHSLAIKRSSRLKIEWDQYAAYRMENSDNEMRICETVLRGIDLKPYYLYRQKNMAGNLENVGYAKEGYESPYNILIMEETKTIWAAGAGAVSKIVSGERIERAANVHDVETYIRNIDEMIERKRGVLQEIFEEA